MNNIQPIIIIGAPRSGTNILRNTLTRVSLIDTWDCDEIPYIWLYGNKYKTTDLIKPHNINFEIKKYIRGQFTNLAQRKNVKYIVEKTCANSLRVEFVDKIIPEAKYIYIEREPLDAIYSTMLRWNSSFDFKYTLKKFKYVPKLDIPYYSYKFLKNRIFKNRLKNRMNFWGPRFIEENRLAGKSIEEISAEQWVCCVKAAKGSLLKISGERVFHLTYENFVSNPKTILKELIDFIGIELNENFLMPEIKKSSVGKGARNLKKKQKLIINKIINEASLNNV